MNVAQTAIKNVCLRRPSKVTTELLLWIEYDYISGHIWSEELHCVRKLCEYNIAFVCKWIHK